MTALTLPALTGDSPLGILAAMGVARILDRTLPGGARLSWDETTQGALLHSELKTLGQVVSHLEAVVSDKAPGSLIPGVPGGFPPPGAAPDGLRVPQASLRGTARTLFSEMSPGERDEAQCWLASLVTDLARDDQERGAISQFTAPAGKQSMATMLEKPLELVRKTPDYLRQALVGWRRVPGVTGENLDHRAIWGAPEDGSGRAEMRGVPGATWLALMSFPLFRTTSARGKPVSSGWHTVRAGRRSYQELRLPLWKSPLGPAGITAVIEHPALDAALDTPESSAALRLLGVFHVCRARRYQPPGGQSAGLLSPLT